MPNPENLNKRKSFVKGDPRINRTGQNKVPGLPDLKKILADVLGETKEGKTAAEAIVMKLRQMATQGNLKAAEILLNRGYGLPKQAIEMTGKDGSPINVIFAKGEGCENVSDAGS
jgi:hypothetical protein